MARSCRRAQSSAPDSAGLASTRWPGLGPHRVRITLNDDSRPSTTIEADARVKKFAAVAWCVDSHQPPAPIKTSRALCASTGPTTLAAPCEEKYIDDARPMKAYIGAAVARYCRLAARTPASPVKMLTQRSGKIAIKVAIAPTATNETVAAVQAIRRARAIRLAPTAMPIIGTEAIPNANDTEVSRYSSRAPMP